MMGKRIVFATTGSLGDLHPFLAVGQSLRDGGYDVTVATTRAHQTEVEKAGLTFAWMRPDPKPTPEFHARFMDTRTSAKFVFKGYLSPAIQQSYDDLVAITKDADLLVSQTLALAAPLVAAKTGIPWLSAVFQPMTLFSACDPPALPFLPFLRFGNDFALRFNQRLLKYAKKFTLPWVNQVLDLRKSLSLADDAHPIYEGQHAPSGVLAMFSPLLGERQTDWPPNTIQTGAALLPQPIQLSTDLQEFLARGSAPLVFTLGASSSNDPGQFYQESLAAARLLGQRALLMTAGLSAQISLPDPLPEWAMRVDYAPYGPVFQRAKAVIHAGGIAAGMLALKAGVPQVFVPFAHDQLDNSTRLQRLGIGRIIPRNKYKAKNVARTLAEIFNDTEMHKILAKVSHQANAEDGVTAARREIERFLKDGL